MKHTPNHNLRTKTLLANNVLKDVDAKHFKSTFSAVKYRVYLLNKSESFKVCYFYTVIVLSSSIDFTAAVAQRARVCASKGSERLGVLFQAVTDLSKKKQVDVHLLGDDHYKRMPRVIVGVAR